MSNKNVKVVFLLSKILGNKTFSSHVENVVKSLDFVDPAFIYFSGDDYDDAKLPKHIKQTSRNFPSEWIRYKYDLQFKNIEEDHILFFQSGSLIKRCQDLFRTRKSIVALDATNITGHYLVYNQNKTFLNYLRFKLVSFLTSLEYRKVMPHVTHFLPRTEWCAESLRRDYGISNEKITVCPGGIDTDLWKPTERPENRIPQLLFVGNDFLRKGGEILVSVFKNYLKGKAHLCIISKDPYLDNYKNEEGITIVNTLTHERLPELIRYYNNSDIFVFPTKSDQMGQVLLEASSMSLPMIGTAVGGTSEIIKHDETGYLIPFGSQEAVWGETILKLIEKKELRKRFGQNARALALSHFSKNVLMTRLENLLRTVAVK